MTVCATSTLRLSPRLHKAVDEMNQIRFRLNV